MADDIERALLEIERINTNRCSRCGGFAGNPRHKAGVEYDHEWFPYLDTTLVERILTRPSGVKKKSAPDTMLLPCRHGADPHECSVCEAEIEKGALKYNHCALCGEQLINHVVGTGHCPFYSTEKETVDMAHGEPRPEDAHRSTFGNAIHNNDDPGVSYGEARERAPQRDIERCLKCDHTWQQHYLYEGCGGYTAGEKCDCYYSRPQARALGAASEVIERLRREVAVLRGLVDKIPHEQAGSIACRICFRDYPHDDKYHEQDIECVNRWREYRLGIGDFGSGLTQWVDEMQRAIARRSTPSTDPARVADTIAEYRKDPANDALFRESKVELKVELAQRLRNLAIAYDPAIHDCGVAESGQAQELMFQTLHQAADALTTPKPSEATQALIAELRAPCYAAVHTDAGVHSNPACANWRAADALAAVNRP